MSFTALYGSFVPFLPVPRSGRAALESNLFPSPLSWANLVLLPAARGVASGGRAAVPTPGRSPATPGCLTNSGLFSRFRVFKWAQNPVAWQPLARSGCGCRCSEHLEALLVNPELSHFSQSIDSCPYQASASCQALGMLVASVTCHLKDSSKKVTSLVFEIILEAHGTKCQRCRGMHSEKEVSPAPPPPATLGLRQEATLRPFSCSAFGFVLCTGCCA